MRSRRTSSVPKGDVVFPRMLYCDSRCSQTLTGLSLALPGALLCNATRRLGDRQRVILRQRVRGSVRALRAVWNTWVFQTESRVVADVYSYPSTHGISGLAAGGVWEQFKVHLKMTIDYTQRYPPRPWSSEFADAVGGGDREYLEIHLEAMIMWTLKPWSYVFGVRNRASLAIHYEAGIERVWWCTWRPWSCELGNAIGGRNCLS